MIRDTSDIQPHIDLYRSLAWVSGQRATLPPPELALEQACEQLIGYPSAAI